MEEIFTNARDAVAWIEGARWKGEKKGLSNTRALLSRLGNPEKRMGRIVHVAGTNGKGSVCAMIDKGLRACGYKTALYTSPYLCAFPERIRVNGRPIPDNALLSVANRVRAEAEALSREGTFCTTFELITSVAFLYYAEEKVNFSVVEVGMGGRLDATNVVTPEVSVIASIGLDHMAHLGNTLPEIAGEKAGIIKPGVPAVTLARQTPEVINVFREVCRQNRAPLFESDAPVIENADARGLVFTAALPAYGLIRQKIALPGLHQADNAALALTALDRLKIDMRRASEGVAATRWPGRLEWIGNTLIDGAHNPQGARSLKAYHEQFLAGRKTVLLTGMMRDKQLSACAEILAPFADNVICTQVNWPRAVKADELTALYGARALAVADVDTALERAKTLAGEDGVIVVAGSLYLAGAVRALLLPDDNGCI